MPTSGESSRQSRRLGCQTRICGDLVVDVPAESQVHRQVVRKRAEEHPIEIDPVVRLHYVEVREPDLREPSSDFRRLQEALAAQWGVAGADADLATLAGLQKALGREAGRRRLRFARGATSSRSSPASPSALSASQSTLARRRSQPISATS